MKRRTGWFVFVATILLLFGRQALAADYSGIWWDPAFAGQGVTVHHEKNNNIFGGWYMYDSSGLSEWVTFEGALSGNTLTTTFKRFTGPSLGGAWDPSEVVGTPTGTVALTFNSPASATFAYGLDGNNGILNLVRFGTKTQHLDGHYRGALAPASPMVGPIVCAPFSLTGTLVNHDLAAGLYTASGELRVVLANVTSAGAITGAIWDYTLSSQIGSFSGVVNGVSGGGSWTDVYGCTGMWTANAQ